jgi:glyoxylase-like metal-dependent hydrolase (beta-lactamase superfamily II)
MSALDKTMRVFKPYPYLLAFYDGRIEGVRLHSPAPNWLDDGAFTLGVCSFAVISGEEALVYDTHISLDHAQRIRAVLAEHGVCHIRVALSHWHPDHVAGNEVFADCEIIAEARTLQALQDNRDYLETGTPPIFPLVLPNLIFNDRLKLQVGEIEVELRHADIHSFDGVAVILPDGVMLAGDMLEDSVTYVTEPERLEIHLAALRDMQGWDIKRILPNHGVEKVIAAGGYGPELVEATRLYVEKLLRLRDEPALAEEDFRTFAAASFDTGGANYFIPYEPVHKSNVQSVLALYAVAI